MVIKYLMLIVLFCSACSGVPAPPELNPLIIAKDKTDPMPGHLYAIPCTVSPDFSVKCTASDSVPVNDLFVNYFLIQKDEVASWRRWGKDIVQNYDCKKK